MALVEVTIHSMVGQVQLHWLSMNYMIDIIIDRVKAKWIKKIFWFFLKKL